MLFALPTRADPGFQLSASVGLGQFAAGASSARFSIVPTGSLLLLHKERWLLRLDDAVTLIGATGGGFGIANTTTLAFGVRGWESVNVSAGFTFAAYSLPLCGDHWCGRARGLAPGLDARVDAFHPGLLRGALGLSATCGTFWIVGDAIWNGFSTQCTLGPIVRWPSMKGMQQ
jgi:hypothetical protein